MLSGGASEGWPAAPGLCREGPQVYRLDISGLPEQSPFFGMAVGFWALWPAEAGKDTQKDTLCRQRTVHWTGLPPAVKPRRLQAVWPTAGMQSQRGCLSAVEGEPTVCTQLSGHVRDLASDHSTGWLMWGCSCVTITWR